MTPRCCAAVARGDEEALASLYDRHAGWLTVRLTRRCAMPDVVDQAVQDTFLAVWRQAARLPRGRRRGRVHLGHRRSPADRCDPPGELDRRGGCCGGRRSRRWSSRPRIRCCSASSTAASVRPWPRCHRSCARAIEATVLDGLTCAEAAVLLGVAEGTVKSRCHRARQALRAALADAARTRDSPRIADEAWETP